MPISTTGRARSAALGTLLFAIACTGPLPALARRPGLPPETEQAIAAVATKVLAETWVPSVSIAIVKDGELAYAKAFGAARLTPRTAATPELRYKIASNSKQMAAAAVMLLVEEGKLSLDDPVSRFFPKLTRAGDISVRQLLDHTSGYQDYYAVDYLAPSLQRDVTPDGILALYAQKPLDFEPGTRYQYSNTNYVLIGRIIEQVSGEPLAQFLRTRIFDKLGMDSAIDVTVQPLGPADPAGYTRYALGTAREVGAEGKGWMWAMGQLAMSASDLAKWDISLMEGSLLTPASLKALSTATVLSDGTVSGYALGLAVSQMANGHRRWSHTGGASGFPSANATYPDDLMSITVLTNGDSDAHRTIHAEIEKLLFAGVADPAAASSLARARELFVGLQKGQIDRSTMTADLGGYFDARALGDFASSLAPLGDVVSISQASKIDRGGMAHRKFVITTATKKKLSVEAYVKPDGRFDQYLIREIPG